MSSEDALIIFTPSGRRGRFPLGTPVLQAARALGVDIDSVCGGRALCGRCQILLSEGEFAKHGVTSSTDNLSPFSEMEARYQKEVGALKPGRRLSCSSQLLGDVVIDVPPESQVHRQVVRKRAEVHDIELDPVVRIYYVEVQEPDMHDPSGDLRRLQDALEFEWRLTELRCDLRFVQDLQSALRAGGWKVTVAIHDAANIIAVWPGYRDKIYGLAFDIGSTTIAAHLCDLSSGDVLSSVGVMNPQIRFGEDLMSRVSYIMMNPGGEAEMTAVVREAVNQLAADAAAEAGVETTDILEATFVGNPVMHHLFLGINPIELGGAPFALATDEAVNIWASEVDLHLHPNARAYILPCVAGHVGADAAGVILSEAPYLRDEITLLVDVGTNAEIVLGKSPPLARGLQPDRSGLRGCTNQRWPTCGSRRYRTRAN